MSAPGGASYSCTRYQPLCGEDCLYQFDRSGEKVYSTNVPGIGMRFSRGGATVNITYPDVFSSTITRTTNYSLEGSALRWRSLKPPRSPAAVPGGEIYLLRLGAGQHPILETYLSANAITVVSPSCTVLSGKNMNVDVGTIKRSDLNGVGTSPAAILILSCSAAAG
jgi:hypothetical protein